MTAVFRVIAIVSVLSSTCALAFAQDNTDQAQPEPEQLARFHWGPLHFTPGIAINNVGVDSNVFNDSNNQLQDTTAAIGPAINVWTKIGPLHVAERSAGQYLYFKQYENQRSWNTANDVRLEMPLGRLKPFAVGSYVNSKERPGFEIDSRARASTNIAGLGTSIHVSGKTDLVLNAERTTITFDRTETFLGATLADALNRHTDHESLQFRYRLTPLTTFVLTTEAIQDRFDSQRTRNADSIRVAPGFEFKPFALIAGRASVGFRHFNVLNDAIEDYQGATASVDAKYLLTTSTQLSVGVSRDLSFSYDEMTPYYSLTDTSVTVDQRLFKNWDVAVLGSLGSLSYRGLRTTLSSSADRTDTARVVGLNIGYLIGQTFRVGCDVNYYSRRSQ